MSQRMEPVGFVARAEDLMARLESAIDLLADDLDIDVQRTGNVITLAFENGHRIIVNTQEAAEEIWVAARSGGFHYRWSDATSRWNDTRSGDDLATAVARLIATETGTVPIIGL